MSTSSNAVHPHESAVVVGASMVGMAVARALSECFNHVFVVEKDVLPVALPDHRPGVQQSHHVHNLTIRGLRELDSLFPGFSYAALDLGAVPLDYGRDVARCTDVGFCPLFESRLVALAASRSLFEFAQRQRFRALTRNVTLLEGARVEGLIVEPKNGKVHAVGVRTNHGEHRAALVVDCSGRAALWKGWFKEHGLPVPEETVVDSRSGYASRFYRVNARSPYLNKAMTVDPLFPQRPQWGVISPIEDGQWVVTIGGFGEQYPPGDELGFERFGDRLQTPLFQEWLKDAEPISPVRTFRRLEMRWNHFERGAAIAGFLAVGDSAWGFNPQYGQGISAGVTCARILRDVLRKDTDLESLAHRYYVAAKKFAYPAWRSTALLDLAWPSTQGSRPWYTELSRRLGHTFLRACQYEDEAFLAFLQAVHMLKQPHELVTLKVLWAMARYSSRRALGILPPMDLTRLPRHDHWLRDLQESPGAQTFRDTGS